jgi:putative DNA-invertase from lambdoid prophage Rac
LALGVVDLTSAADKMIMGMIAAVAKFERDLPIERTHAGLTRAKAEGKTLGRKPKLTDDQTRAVRVALAAGEGLGKLAKQFGVSRAAIRRQRAKALVYTDVL